MSATTHSNSNIHDEENYDPTVWVPEQHSHGTKDIWMKFWILLGLTIIDVVFYFAMDPSMARNVLFIVLGVVKAIYIVGTFMHMKHEKLSLASMIIVPMVFILFFVYWMLYEGNFWGSFN
ncbi:cytochrome C oxidase subunit IV family protein [bacterium]|nr:cytochrome C oxidase subunit IV family protein [bacterium]